MGYVRTAILLAAMTALFGVVGLMLGGEAGLIIALVLAAGMNLFAFWSSDKMVLRMHNAVEVDARTAPELVPMVHDLADRAGGGGDHHRVARGEGTHGAVSPAGGAGASAGRYRGPCAPPCCC